MTNKFNYPANVAKNLISKGYKLKAVVAQTGDMVYMNSKGDLRVLYNQTLKSRLGNKILNALNVSKEDSEISEVIYNQEVKKISIAIDRLKEKNTELEK